MSAGVADIANALPPVIVGILVAAAFGPGTAGASVAVGLISWPPLAAHASALVQETRAAGFLTAQKAIGSTPRWILNRHLLPAVAGPVARHAVLRLPGIALALASLGFLGLGAQPPAPEWGLLLDESRAYLERAPGRPSPRRQPSRCSPASLCPCPPSPHPAARAQGRRRSRDHAPQPLLSVRDLRMTLPDGVRHITPVRGLSFDVHEGEVLAVVGESGAGKSLTAHAVLGMAPYGAQLTGSVRLRGQELLGAPRSVYAGLWGRHLALGPQDALAVLSPVHTVGDQLAAAIRSVRGLGRKTARAEAAAALDGVGIADAARRAKAYPHEFSGGMRQRVVIAMAMVNDPELIVADEPTTALDPAVQEQVLGVLASLREATGAAMLLVTHDLGIVAGHADRTLVMYAGRHSESGPVEWLLTRPRAPYTAGLLASLPPDEPTADRRLPAIGGTPPSPSELSAGCAFAPRCPLAQERCRTDEPEPQPVGPAGHLVSCHRWEAVPASARDLFPVGGMA
ncbi:oligopeptide/dipeptide ABC transporter ATP-binding protein [Streptomyces sp. NPDC051219]|uniref:dipeptide/oligopeptide/nickel ABC transporter permease/ATP-binding protein n=1 Tax=Streptomyces sp. NPDC051219 TaxID=3155283 RepID=UPI0034154C7D